MENKPKRRELLMQCLQTFCNNGFIRNNCMVKKEARKFYNCHETIPHGAPPFEHFLSNLRNYKVIEKQKSSQSSDVIIFNERKLKAFMKIDEVTDKDKLIKKLVEDEKPLGGFRKNDKIIKKNQKKSVQYIVAEIEEGYGNGAEIVYFPMYSDQLLLNILNISTIPVLINNIDASHEILKDLSYVQMTKNIEPQCSIDIILDINYMNQSDTFELVLIITYKTSEGDEMVLRKIVQFININEIAFSKNSFNLHLLNCVKPNDCQHYSIEINAVNDYKDERQNTYQSVFEQRIEIVNKSTSIAEVCKIIPTNLSVIKHVAILGGTHIIEPNNKLDVSIKVITDVIYDFDVFIYINQNQQEVCLMASIKTPNGVYKKKRVLIETGSRWKLVRFPEPLRRFDFDSDEDNDQIISMKIKREMKWWRYQSKEIVIEVAKDFGNLPESIFCKSRENQVIINIVNLSDTSVSIEKVVPLFNKFVNKIFIQQVPSSIRPKSKVDVFIKVLFDEEACYEHPLIFYVKLHNQTLHLVKRVRFFYRIRIPIYRTPMKDLTTTNREKNNRKKGQQPLKA